MLFFKFSLISFLLLSFSSFAMFSDKDCLDGNFKSEVTHKAGLFGLSKNQVSIEKENCVLKISHERYKFMKKRWLVDVCRGPIHIKYGTNGVTVFKKKVECLKKEHAKDGFCNSWDLLKQVLQDDGLIFADGEKESLSSDHGKVYCSYLLLTSYLNKEIIFNRHHEYKNIIVPKNQDGFIPSLKCDVSKKTEEVADKKDEAGDKKLKEEEDQPKDQKTGSF